MLQRFSGALRSGRLFYQRHLGIAFPELPERAFIRIIRVRATSHPAAAVKLEIETPRPLTAVFWDYKSYGNANHSRDFNPPRYILAVAPLSSVKPMSVFLLDAEPFAAPRIDVSEWRR
jgi:hypothetical protein